MNAIMMYPFMTLNDDTEITHSEMKADGKVKVYIETPDEFGGFHNATCWLPDYRWEDIEGYSDTEMAYFKQLIRNNAHLIIEFSQEGGILNADKEIVLDNSGWKKEGSILMAEEGSTISIIVPSPGILSTKSPYSSP